LIVAWLVRVDRRWRGMLAILCLACLSPQVAAAHVTVVLSDDSAPYQEIHQIVRVLLSDAGHQVRQIYAAGLPDSAREMPRLTVAVGVAAAEAVAVSEVRGPVLAVLVPRSWFVRSGRTRLAAGGRRTVSAIYIDQPFERQAQLARLAFPEARRVGVLLGAEQAALAEEIGTALAAHQLELVLQTVAPGERLISPLETVLSGVDLLLAVPDPQIFNRNTAQSIFLTTYRYRVPVQGYSHSLTRAGALVSLHSSPAQIGRQAAEWVIQVLDAAAPRLPAPAYPAYFSVSVNEQVARSLGIAMTSEAELERRLGGTR
jgi:hypothetical protein